MVNWINSWKSNNKKSKYNFTIRLGKFTLIEIETCFCNTESCTKFRFILFNFGFEI